MPMNRHIDGYSIFFYSNEGELSEPPNIYVGKHSSEAEFIISSSENPTLALRRSFGFSSQELNEIHSLLTPLLTQIRSDWSHVFC